MLQSYILWALLGMAGYSVMTLFLKIAERAGAGTVSTYMVLAVSTTIVAIFAITVVALRGELKTLVFDLDREPLLWAIAGGIALTVAVSSLFHALSLWSRQCGGADLRHVYRRWLAARRAVSRRTHELAQVRRPHCRGRRGDPDLALGPFAPSLAAT
jgi:uncharacterized membrane protein